MQQLGIQQQALKENLEARISNVGISIHELREELLELSESVETELEFIYTEVDGKIVKQGEALKATQAEVANEVKVSKSDFKENSIDMNEHIQNMSRSDVKNCQSIIRSSGRFI